MLPMIAVEVLSIAWPLKASQTTTGPRIDWPSSTFGRRALVHP